jgi:hypothetical protein
MSQPGPFAPARGLCRVTWGVMAAQLDIFGKEHPLSSPEGDTGLADRLQRRQSNRDRLVGKGAGRERHQGVDTPVNDGDPHTAHMSGQYGIRNVQRSVMSDRRNSVPYGPDDTPVFRKHGVRKEVPLHGPDAITTMQSKVHPGRVSEIATNPSSGSNPRFPGREVPLSVQMLVHPRDESAGPGGTDMTQRRVPTEVTWDGNHRIAAAVERGELFTPVQSITQDAMPDAANQYRRDKREFATVRELKYRASTARMEYQDPTLTGRRPGR